VSSNTFQEIRQNLFPGQLYEKLTFVEQSNSIQNDRHEADDICGKLYIQYIICFFFKFTTLRNKVQELFESLLYSFTMKPQF
jgi:hypothetical protein